MKQRYIVLTIDTIAELLKDYMSTEDIPSNAVPIRLMIKPTEKGALALDMFSLDWEENLPPLVAHFDIKRVYGIGASK